MKIDFLYKNGWLFLIIAMLGDIIISLVLAKFYSGYSITKMSISALGNPSSPVRIPFNIWMIIEGLLFLTAIPAIYKYYRSVSGGLTKTVVLFVMSDKPEFENSVIQNEGLWQRLNLIFMYLPLIIVSIKRIIQMDVAG